MVRERFSVAAAGIASYDLAFDPDGRVLGAALACVGLLAAPTKPAVWGSSPEKAAQCPSGRTYRASRSGNSASCRASGGDT
jgi:hypothetical protein